MTNGSGGSKLRNKIKETLENFSNMPDEQKNFLQVYYGYGKGKTTSTLGLAIRALGAGRKVAIIQFDKGFDGTNEHYSERHIFRKLKDTGFDIDLYPTGCERMNEDGTFRFKNEKKDLEEAQRGLKLAKELIVNGDQKLLILDEIIATVVYHLLEKKDVEDVIKLFRENRRFELVMTGHKIWDFIEENADLITEMRKVKHYFDKGIPAREGIEF